jgi:hypothetical protein
VVPVPPVVAVPDPAGDPVTARFVARAHGPHACFIVDTTTGFQSVELFIGNAAHRRAEARAAVLNLQAADRGETR